jgi:hypothetical protein
MFRIKSGDNNLNRNGKFLNLFINNGNTPKNNNNLKNNYIKTLSEQGTSPYSNNSQYNKTQNFGFSKNFSVNSNNNINNHNIFNKKSRNIYSHTKLFSLLDVDEKITNSKGTSLPVQYKRLTPSELKTIFGVTYTTGWNYDKNFMKKIMENTEKQKNELKMKRIKIIKSNSCQNFNDKEYNVKLDNYNENNKIKKFKKKENLILNENNIQLNDKDDNLKNLNTEKNLKNSNTINHFPLSLNEKENMPKKEIYKSSDNINYQKSNRKDRWLPKGYNDYELLVKNPHLLKLNFNSNNVFAGKLPLLNLKEIQYKSTHSDIFFQEPPSKHESDYIKRVMNIRDTQNSDIFLQKNDLDSVCKSGETYLFKPQKKFIFNNSIESNSTWTPHNPKKGLINHCSTEYNLVNGTKNFSQTKNDIMIESKNLKINPIHKQKGLNEFTDLTRVSAPNISKPYNEAYKNNQDVFKKRTDICGNYYDIHGSYRDLCDRPFYKLKF